MKEHFVCPLYCTLINPWIMEQKSCLVLLYRVHFVPVFSKLFSQHFSFKFQFIHSVESKCCFCSDFSFLMHLYRVTYIKCLRTRKYILEHKCEWNLSLVWLLLAIVTFYLNCLGRVVLAHPFWTLATFPVCPSVCSCRTNRAPSILSSPVFLHICSWSCLFASDTHCSHGPACMSVNISTISPSSYTVEYQYNEILGTSEINLL